MLINHGSKRKPKMNLLLLFENFIHACNIFDQTYPHSIFSSSSFIPPFPSSLCTLFLSPLNQLKAACMCTDVVGLSTRAWIVFQDLRPWRNWFSLPQQPLLLDSCLVRGGAWISIHTGILTGLVLCRSWAFSHSYRGFLCAMTLSCSAKFLFLS